MTRAQRRVVVKESTGSRVLTQSRLRLLCVGLVFGLCFLSIGVRLIELVARNPMGGTARAAKAEAAEQADPEDGEVVLPAERLKRADITDRNGVVLATSLMTSSAFANPREIKNPEEASARLSQVVGIPQAVLLKRIRGHRSFVWIKRQLTPAEQQAVNNLGIPGVYFAPEERRVYPHGVAFSHSVGYVGLDNTGLAGLEKSFDAQLMDDRPGGRGIRTSLDVRVQHALRDEMRRAVEEFRAIGATGAVVDVQTGELLALSSLPDFDPHQPARASDAQKFNRAALGTYEMGSTFKSFTMAMALDSKSIVMKDGFDASRPLHFANFTITDAHGKNRWLSVPEIYAYSSNIGTAKVLLQTGVARQKEFMAKLGMTSPIEVELPERAQPLYPKDWKEINAITIAYGHGISVTPLHLMRGIAALVNGGTLPKLTLLPARGEVAGERVIAEDTSLQMRRLMRLVVKHGTAGKADIPGYRIGGKTGTAEKVQVGGYSKDNKMASFVAVFPMDAPRYAVLVMVDEPKGTKATYGYATGGWVAAPAVGRVIARIAPMLDVKPAFEVADDDAEKYWYDTEKKPSQEARASYARPPFLRPAAYSHR